jgi:hypothetical protein
MSLTSALQLEEVLVLDAIRRRPYMSRLVVGQTCRVIWRPARLGGVGAVKGVAAVAPPATVIYGIGAAVMDGLGAAVIVEGEIR